VAPIITDPNLEILILTPRAKANSFPLNHTVTIEDYATLIDSPPSPKINRPANIIG
jgi:hypothetical protein